MEKKNPDFQLKDKINARVLKAQQAKLTKLQRCKVQNNKG